MKAPLFYDAVMGSRAFSLFLKDASSSLGHAYMVVCPDDETVAEFFTLAATTLFCETGSACLECSACRRVLANGEPDITEIFPDGTAVKVAQIKAMTADAYISPTGSRKLYFVHRADLMTAEAQNKLLKTLEEPPENVTFFLGTANQSCLLDTVRSRCRPLVILPFPRETVFAGLRALGVDKDTAAAAASCSDGCLGRAKQFADSPRPGEMYREAAALLAGMKRSPDVLAASRTPSLAANAAEFLPLLTTATRDVLTIKTGGSVPAAPETAALLKEAAATFSLRALAVTQKLINKALEELSYRVDTLSVTDNLLFSILEVKHKWQS